MPGALTNKTQPLRNQIAMNEPLEVKYWTKHLGVTRDDLQRAVDKVGQSAAVVRKELGKMKTATAPVRNGGVTKPLPIASSYGERRRTQTGRQ